MDPQFLEEVVGTRFPGAVNDGEGRTNEGRELQLTGEEPQDTAENGSPESAVTEEELAGAVERIGARKAPGPDGVPSRLWKEVARVLAPRLRTLFDRCLSRGEFPVLWKEGRMVLLPKPGRTSDSPSAFRSVCLLDQAGKLLERVVAARLESHLSRRDPGLHDSQFGFRKGESTADTIGEGSVRRGYVALAVSLDVVNAFNSIPWGRISRALEFHRVPIYLRGVIRAFLRDCSIVYTGRGGRMMGRAVCRGIPHDVRYWARCCGTSRTTRYFGHRCPQTRR
jgi:hypothetical protein